VSFDYAIKQLLRHKSDYDIIEGFISGLFAAQGYPAVKINAVLESESNKESFDLADLVVKDAEGNKYIVEIERSYTPNFMHKACFNSCRLIEFVNSTGKFNKTVTASNNLINGIIFHTGSKGTFEGTVTANDNTHGITF